MKFVLLAGAAAALRVTQKGQGDFEDFEKHAHKIFHDCAGEDKLMQKKEAVACAKKHGQGEHADDIAENWPKNDKGEDIDVSWRMAKKFFEEHRDEIKEHLEGKGEKLAQGEKEDTMDDPKAIFNFCAGDDGILEMHEAQKCASKHVADLIDHHWPRDSATGKPVKATWEDMKKWHSENM